ncbi:MAG: hypothetical protein JST04_11300 [Bdellovibrionales bacterium]|nr:hypothetical protein [Bdellovibrionales bacterium]
MRSNRNLSRLVLLSFLAGQLPTSALADPLPTNPDDYDVPKYQRLYDGAAAASKAEERKEDGLAAAADRAKSQLAARQARLSDLNAKITAAQNELANLQKSNQDLDAEAARLQSSLTSLDSGLSAAQSDLRNAEAALAQIQTQLDAANRAVAEKQSAYDSKNRELSPIEDQLRTKQSQLDSVKSALSSARSRISSAEGELPGLQSKLSQLKSRESTLGSEIDRAKAALSKATADADLAQQAVSSTGLSLRNAQSALAAAKAANKPADEIARLQANVDSAQSAAQSARLAYAEAAKRKTDAAGDVSRGEQEIVSVRADIPRTQNRIGELNSQLSRDRSQVASLEPQVSQLESDVSSLRSRADSLRSEVARAKADLDRAKADTEGVRSRASQLQANVSSARSRVTSLSGQLDTAKKQIAANRAKIDQNRVRIATIDSSLPGLRRDRDEAQAGLDGDQRAVTAANAAVLDQRNRVRDAKVAEQQARTRLTQVQTNLQNGIAAAERDGQRDGRETAGRDGIARGTDAGNRDGAVAGTREGSDAGRAEGVRVAQTNGGREGQVRGAADGSAKGSQDGGAQGLSEGTRLGSEEGLKQGQAQGADQGEDAGLAEGTRVGHTQGSYDRGFADGQKSGRARGEREGSAKGSEDGTKQADREALGAKLAAVTLPMASAPQRFGFSGSNLLAAAEKNSEDRAFASSTFGRYPIPELDRRYDAAYRETYQAVYDRQYQASAAAAYDRAYRQTYQVAYDRAVRADYSAEYNAAYQANYVSAEDAAYRRSYDAAYKTSYDSAYQREYQRVFPGAHDSAYKTAYGAAYERGRLAANAADLERGRKEGDAKGYASAYSSSYASAKASAYANRKAYYDSSAILQLQNAVANDANRDNVNVPGEAIALNLGIKNFGRVASGGDVRVELSAASSGLEILAASTTLPALPAVSNVLLTGVDALRVRPSAAIGSKQSVTVSLVAGGQVLGSSEIHLTVGTTISLSVVEVPTKVRPNVENSIRVIVKNLSTKAALGEARVEIVSADGLSVISTGTLSVGVLQGSEAKEVKSSFRYVDAPAPEKLGIQVSIRVGDATYDTKALNVKSAERYAYNASSRGVLVVNAAETVGLAQQARKSSMLGLDLYDERQEGAMSSTTAAKYVGKFIIAPEAAPMKDATIASIKSAISKGAHLLVGLNDRSAKSDIANLALALAKKNPTRDFLGMKLSERNGFTKSASATKVLLANPASAIGVEGLANALLIGDIVLKSATEKAKSLIAATTARDTRAADLLRGALASELAQEMLDDVAANGKNFEKSPSKLKLTAVTTVLAGAAPAERAVLGALYGSLEAARTTLAGREERKEAIRLLLEPLKAAAEGR